MVSNPIKLRNKHKHLPHTIAMLVLLLLAILNIASAQTTTAASSVADKASRLCHEFYDNVLAMRKCHRWKDEIKYIVTDRHALAHHMLHHPNQDSQSKRKKVDAAYWHAASVVLQGLPLDLYSSTSVKTSGLVFATNGIPLGGFSKHDMGSPNQDVTKDTYETTDGHVSAFPKNNMFFGGKSLFTWKTVHDKLVEMKERVNGERPDKSTNGKLRNNIKTFSDLLIPRDKKPYAGAESLPYNEAQIHFTTDDILGVLVDVDATDSHSAIEACKFQIALLDQFDLALPLVDYQRGSVSLFLTPLKFAVAYINHPEAKKIYEACVLGEWTTVGDKTSTVTDKYGQPKVHVTFNDFEKKHATQENDAMEAATNYCEKI